MSFDLLSNELVAEIFTYLDITGLSCVSLCCRRLHNVAEPYLYSKFVQTNKQAMPMFLRTLVDKPYLAKYVKHFTGSTINSEFYRWLPAGGFDLAKYLKQHTQASQWIREQLPPSILWSSRIHVWHRHLCNNLYWDPIAALILLLCSENIQSIDMASYGSEVADWIDYLLQRAAAAQNDLKLPNFFPRLRRVKLSYWDNKGHMNLDYVLPYLSLKFLSEFRGEKIGSHMFTSDLSKFDELVFTTGSLSLTQSNLKGDVMKKFLLCFHSLKRVEYEHAGVTSGGLARFLPSAVREGLQNSKHCLEELTLRNPDERWDAIPADETHLLGSLREFEELKILDADFRTLLGREHQSLNSDSQANRGAEYNEIFSLKNSQVLAFASSIPGGLDHLIIRECTNAIYDLLEKLLLGDGFLPKSLKTLTLDFQPNFSTEDQSGMRLGVHALKHGLKLTLYCNGTIIKAMDTDVFGY